MEALFLDGTLEFEKVGAEVTLPDDPNGWPTEILQELFKQVPYISDFEPDVIMDRVDAEKRFGFGHVEVSNKTDIQEAPESPVAQSAGIRHVRIPIIIKEGKLQPFDVIVTDTSKMLPLTERRLRQSLFRPQLFDVTSRTPGDQSMISQLYPPYRQNYGFGGGGAAMTAGMGKEGADRGQAFRSAGAAGAGLTAGTPEANALRRDAKEPAPDDTMPPYMKEASLLKAILPTINQQDYSDFAEKVAEMKSSFFLNRDAINPSFETLSKYEPIDIRHRAAKIAHAIRPTVLQVTHIDGGGYTLKTANHGMWLPVKRNIDRGQLVELLGTDVALGIDKHGSITMGETEVDADLPEHDQPENIKDYGIYKVQDSEGRHLIGFVFPNLIDIDGKPMPMALFTNGSHSTVQGEIVGVKVAEGAAIVEGRPRGYGVFYKVLQNGKAVATVPFEIHATLQQAAEESGGTGGVALVAKSPMHGDLEMHIQIQPNIANITSVDEQNLLVPDDWSWLPLDKSESTVLVDNVDAFEKYAQKVNAMDLVEIRAGGQNSFSISGPPVEKLAMDERSWLDVDAALFMLAGVGISPEYGIKKLGEAVHWQDVIHVRTSHGIQPAEEVRQQIAEKVAASIDQLPNLRQDLLKEAAILPDPTAVDTILSLGFINPENIITFLGYMPAIDEVQSKLCELLVATRLGLQDTNAGALERSIRGVEQTLDGLRTIAFQNN